jgi:hypothetical protein
MPETTMPLPYSQVTLRNLGVTKVDSGETTVRTKGVQELSREVIRSRAVEAVATTIAGLDGNFDETAFEFGLVIKW